jgi:cytochrome c2
MTNKGIVLILIVLFAAACGTIARQVPNLPEEAGAPTEVKVATVVPTSTPLPPTATPTEIPPTATLEPPTATPTEEAQTEEAPQTADDPLVRQVRFSDPANGQVLFNTMNQTGFACATCHFVDSTERLLGPGLLGVPERAATRVEGQVAQRYIYNSITNPSAYVVAEYPDALMPQIYSSVFTETEILDIIAYLMTLSE